MEIINQYPVFRRFVLIRSLVRRAYFKKAFDDNMQEILIRRKNHEHDITCQTNNSPNLFSIQGNDGNDSDSGSQPSDLSPEDRRLSSLL